MSLFRGHFIQTITAAFSAQQTISQWFRERCNKIVRESFMERLNSNMGHASRERFRCSVHFPNGKCLATKNIKGKDKSKSKQAPPPFPVCCNMNVLHFPSAQLFHIHFIFDLNYLKVYPDL
jgi:hypothetical protein